MSAPQERQPLPHSLPIGGAYAHYALGVLVLVYVVNFLDRQILSILNERIKADLGLSDAQMGFLYGTHGRTSAGLPYTSSRQADRWRTRSSSPSTGNFGTSV